MPLYDLFHAPLRKRRHWESFHTSWTASIARQLNKRPLPSGFVAEPHVTLGVAVEVDVATFEEDATEPEDEHGAVTANVWVPPQAPIITSAALSGLDVCEVRVYDDEMARTLVAAMEVVSPANKDRPDHRRAFVATCQAYLQQDVSVVIVDVVTSRRHNLYAELAEFLELSTSAQTAVTSHVYAVSLRKTRRGQRVRVEVWPTNLQVGEPLPELPLFLTQEIAVPFDLEASYNFTCDALRIPA